MYIVQSCTKVCTKKDALTIENHSRIRDLYVLYGFLTTHTHTQIEKGVFT